MTSTTFDTLFGISAPAQGTLAARPTLGGTRPTLTGTSATVTVHDNSAVRGLDINVSAGANRGFVGSGRTGVLVTDLDVTSAGGIAIDLTNTSATFSGGGLNIVSTSGMGFAASGGGTINVSGTGNTISSTTGTALSLGSVAGTIGLDNVSKNGAGTGISLTNTAAGVTISGGTIQNTTTAGVDIDQGSALAMPEHLERGLAGQWR